MDARVTDERVGAESPIETLWLNGDYHSVTALLCAQAPTPERDLRLAQAFLRLGRHADALDALNTAFAEKRFSEPHQVARAHALRGVALAAMGEAHEAKSAAAAASEYDGVTGDAQAEIALNEALVAWMSQDLRTAQRIVGDGLRRWRGAASAEVIARFLMLKGWLFAANEQYIEQGTVLIEALQTLREAPALDLGLVSWALHPLAALARDLDFPHAISVIHDFDQQVAWAPAAATARFQASRAIAWTMALQGDYIKSFRELNKLKALAASALTRILSHLDQAQVAVISDQHILAAAELAEADDIIRAYPWSRAAWEESTALLYAAELFAARDQLRARELFALAQQIRPQMARNAGYVHDRRYDAVSDYTDAVIYLAEGDRRLAAHRAERAYAVFSTIGYQWRSAQSATLMHTITGREVWLEKAKDGCSPYPRSFIAQAVAKKEVGVNPEERLTARQRAIYELAVAGLSNDEIGWRLGIARNTVRLHISRVFRAFGVNDRAHLILEAARLRNIA